MLFLYEWKGSAYPPDFSKTILLILSHNNSFLSNENAASLFHKKTWDSLMFFRLPPVSFDSEFPQAPYSLVLFIKVVKGKLSWVVLYHSMAYCKLQRKVNFLNQRPKSATLYFLYHFSVQDKPDGLPLISIYRQYHH